MPNAKKSLAQRGWLLALLVGVMVTLAACSTDEVPEATSGPASFEFAVDPVTQTLTLVKPDKGFAPQQETAPGEARVLLPNEEIILASISAEFLDDNEVVVEASFTNVTDTLAFLQPFFFTVNEGTENIVSSEEPTVTDDDLGGDGVLSPMETTSVLTFRVQHSGERFTYLVDANAVVKAATGAGTGTVSGYVVNRKAGTAVEGTTVSVEGLGEVATTNENGFYSFEAPAGLHTLVFTQEGFAESRVEGLAVEGGEDTEYSTIQLQIFDPFLPVEAPDLSVNVDNGDLLTGDAENNAFTVTVSGEVVNPNVNGFTFVDVSLSQPGGSSGYLNQFVPQARLFSFEGGPTEVTLSASGFNNATTLHVIGYDLNQNRTELIRYVTVNSNANVSADLGDIEELFAQAVTFGDTGVFGTQSVSAQGVGLAEVAGPTARDVLEAAQTGNLDTLREQAERLQPGVSAQGFLDEAVTWVDLTYEYDFSEADFPAAFEVFRRLEGESDFRSIGRVGLGQAYIGDLFSVENPEDAQAPFLFGFRDASPALQSGLTATYRVEAVAGDERAVSDTASTTPLPTFFVDALNPSNGATDVPVLPTYVLSFENRSDLVFFGVIVLDRVHADDNFVEWLAAFFLSDDPAQTTVGIPHNFNGAATTETLQPYHAYDWQPVAITARADFSALAVAADFFDLFGVGFGVEDGPVNTFVTGDGQED